MTQSSLALLAGYCTIIALLSLLGGFLARKIQLSHTRIQLVMSFVAGLMLGVACYHLLPHAIVSFEGHEGIDSAMWWLVTGLVVMLMLLRLFHFHQHDFSAAGHQCDHHSESSGESLEAAPVTGASWMGIALGLTVHSVIDGLALGAAVVSAGSGNGLLPGLGVFLAVALHKPLDSLSISALMRAAVSGRSLRLWVNALYALMCPIGVLMFIGGVDTLDASLHYWLGAMLAFAAGSFICIALSDLLPEVHFHSHDRIKLTLAFVLGLILAYSMSLVEPEHAHHAHAAHAMMEAK